MNNIPLEKIDIRRIAVEKDSLRADINFTDKGVFMVQLSSGTGEVVHKRFVQFETGENVLRLPVGILQQGHYVLALLKGSQVVKRIFSL